VFSCSRLGPVITPKTRLGRPIDADGDATRTRVLSAARTAFADLGYAATTYRLLAERTGLAPSALYNYFESKVELYASAHNEVQVETYAEWILPAITGTTTFVERVDALLASFAAMNAEDPEAARFQAAARIDTARHPELAEIRDGLATQRRNLFADAVDLGISTGEIPSRSRSAVLAMLETLTLGLVEISAQPEAHRSAVDGFRRAIAGLIAAQGDNL
jgi:AcrR family transcriptional regulator